MSRSDYESVRPKGQRKIINDKMVVNYICSRFDRMLAVFKPPVIKEKRDHYIGKQTVRTVGAQDVWSPTCYDSDTYPVSTRNFVEYIARNKNVDIEELIGAYILTCRVAGQPLAPGSIPADQTNTLILHDFNFHRLFAAAFLVAKKLHNDCYFSNRYAAEFLGLKLAELNNLELDLCLRCDWKVSANSEEYQAFLDGYEKFAGTGAGIYDAPTFWSELAGVIHSQTSAAVPRDSRKEADNAVDFKAAKAIS